MPVFFVWRSRLCFHTLVLMDEKLQFNAAVKLEHRGRGGNLTLDTLTNSRRWFVFKGY